MRGRRIVLVLGALTLLLAACGGDDEGNGDGEECVDLTAEETATITLADNEFDPACAEAARSQPLALENTGSNPHTFTIDGTPVDVEVAAGETANLDPINDAIAADTYTVYCRFHGSADGGGMSMELRAS